MGSDSASKPPMPGTSSWAISVVVSTRNSSSHARLSAWLISPARLSVIIRPTARYCPAPSEMGVVTSAGARGAQVPMESSAVDC